MTGIIILAAGSSSRLGQPKQNLVYKGKTLLQRVVETALSSICQPVVVVLGANYQLIAPTISGYLVEVIINHEWSEGMASSIRSGLKKCLEMKPSLKSVAIMVCDQPFVDTYLVNMLTVTKAHEGICACSYSGTVGVPVLFDAVYFDELLQLKGAEGAKKVMQHHMEKVKEIPFDLGSIDIDTMTDYDRLF